MRAHGIFSFDFVFSGAGLWGFCLRNSLKPRGQWPLEPADRRSGPTQCEQGASEIRITERRHTLTEFELLSRL